MPAKGLSKYTGLLPVYCSEELKAAYVVNRQEKNRHLVQLFH